MLFFHLKSRTKEKCQSNEVSLIFVHLFVFLLSFRLRLSFDLLSFTLALSTSLTAGLFSYSVFALYWGNGLYKMNRLVGTRCRMWSKLVDQLPVRQTSSFSSSDINDQHDIKTASRCTWSQNTSLNLVDGKRAREENK